VLRDQQTFTLNVRTSNQAPVWVTAGNQTIPEGQTLTAQFQAIDPDSDPVTSSASNLPVGAKLDAVTGVLTWNPGLVQVGNYPDIVLAATDGSLTTTKTIAIAVTAVNEPPKFVPLQPQSGREGTQLQFTLSAEDPNQDPLTFASSRAFRPGRHSTPRRDGCSGRLASSRPATTRSTSA